MGIRIRLLLGGFRRDRGGGIRGLSGSSPAPSSSSGSTNPEAWTTSPSSSESRTSLLAMIFLIDNAILESWPHSGVARERRLIVGVFGILDQPDTIGRCEMNSRRATDVDGGADLAVATEAAIATSAPSKRLQDLSLQADLWKLIVALFAFLSAVLLDSGDNVSIRAVVDQRSALELYEPPWTP